MQHQHVLRHWREYEIEKTCPSQRGSSLRSSNPGPLTGETDLPLLPRKPDLLANHLAFKCARGHHQNGMLKRFRRCVKHRTHVTNIHTSMRAARCSTSLDAARW